MDLEILGPKANSVLLSPLIYLGMFQIFPFSKTNSDNTVKVFCSFFFLKIDTEG